MKIPIFQVDAFSREIFGGNPAAVCPLENWLDTETMQRIAEENNLSETAFYVAGKDRFEIRWFTPKIEINLAGHPTLATAHIIFTETDFTGHAITFDSKSGPLYVTREESIIRMDFPSSSYERVTPPPQLVEGLKANPREVYKSRDYLALFDNQEEILALKPDFGKLEEIDTLGIIVTAPGRDSDFVSRFFAPRAGINEDPVTGSAHTTLIPFWARKLSKQKLHAFQISTRRGELFCEYLGERVLIGGRAVTFMRGEITL